MLHTIWLVMIITGCSLLVLAIILTFALKIPEVADELSGRKAKRQIQKLKELNQGTGALDNLGTDEVYSAMSSGSLLSTELAKLENSADIEQPKLMSTSERVKMVVETDDENPTTAMDEDDVPTGFVQSGDVEDDDIGTTLMDDLVMNNIMVSEDTHIETTSGIKIIEEQSSIL